MKVTLRKAHRVVNDLQQKLSVRQSAQTIHHSADENEVLISLSSVEDKNKASVVTALQVADVISEIRKSVSVLNNTELDGNSINALLAEKAVVETKMRILYGYANISTDTQEQRILNVKRKVKDAANQAGSMYSNDVTVTGVSIATHNEFNQQYVELKKEQEAIIDKLSYLNNALQVEIDDKYSSLFKELQVL